MGCPGVGAGNLSSLSLLAWGRSLSLAEHQFLPQNMGVGAVWRETSMKASFLMATYS